MNRSVALKFGVVFGIIVLSLALLGAWSQPWFILTVPAAAVEPTVVVSGQVAAPAVAAFVFASVALAVALSLAGPMFRMVLGLLQLALAGCAVFTVSVALADPVMAGAALVTDATGVSGPLSVHAAVTSVEIVFWSFLALTIGVLFGCVGVLLLATISLWPRSTRRHRPVRMEPADSHTDGQKGSKEAADVWDLLSGGSDPTR